MLFKTKLDLVKIGSVWTKQNDLVVLVVVSIYYLFISTNIASYVKSKTTPDST